MVSDRLTCGSLPSISRTSSGAAATDSSVATTSSAVASVTSRRTKAVPPSGSSRSARASTGTKIAVNVASSTRAAIRLGSWLATENALRQRRAEDRGQQHDAGEPGDPADQRRERHAPRPGHHRRVGQFRAAGPPPRCGPAGQPRRGHAPGGRIGRCAAAWRVVARRHPVERRGIERRGALAVGRGPPAVVSGSAPADRCVHGARRLVGSFAVGHRDVDRIGPVQVGAVGLAAEPVPQPPARPAAPAPRRRSA